MAEWATRAERIEEAMHRMVAPIPSTKGMGPKERAQFLHAELERRIAIARDVLRYPTGPLATAAEPTRDNAP